MVAEWQTNRTIYQGTGHDIYITMRLYLDTNILAFLITGQKDEICRSVSDKLADYSNLFLVSSVCVQELIHLRQIGKLSFRKGTSSVTQSLILAWLDEMGIDVVGVNKKHLQQYSELPLFSDHRDPNDRLIIAQAISDRIPLISSDHKFANYEQYGLELIFNER